MSATQPQPTPNRGRRGRLGFIAAVTVAGLVLAGGVVWGISSLFRPGGFLASPLGLDTTRIELHRDEHALTLGLGFDPSILADQMNGDPADFSGIVEVYTDPELTRRIDTITSVRGEEMTLSMVGRATLETVQPQENDREIGSQDDGWTVYERSYVVRYQDASGTQLAEPAVTEVVTAPRLDSVTPELGRDDARGALTVDWEAVSGADEYLVVLSTWVPEQQFRRYWLLGTTAETTWNSAELRSADDAREQNSGMQLFMGLTEDDGVGEENAADDRRPVEGVEVGVFASNGSAVSPFAPVSAPEWLGELPYQTATKTMKATSPEELASRPLSEFPTGFPVIGLDGQTRETAMQIDPTSIQDWEIVSGRDTGSPTFTPAFAFRATGAGTQLESPRMLIAGTDRAALEREIAAYNERALREHPGGGVSG